MTYPDPTQIPPAVVFARAKSFNYKQAAQFLDCRHSTFKQTVAGFTGMSPKRAFLWERLTDGEINALACLEWHEARRVSV